MPPSPETIRNEILHSAQEWGLRLHVKRDKDFCKKATDAAISSLSPIATLHEELQDAFDYLHGCRLPTDLDDAVRYVLQDALEDAEDSFFVDVSDTLEMQSPPFHRWTDRKTGHTIYKLRHDFRNFAKADLDPFQRFRGEKLDAADWFYLCWHDQKASLDGTVFEAVVAQYLEAHMACASCKCRKSLRWNGGFGVLSSWADIVCIKCQATYEIKTFTNLDRVEMRLKCNEVRCGSFKTFYKYHTPGRRYLLLVSRAASFERGQNRLTHRVTIAEIAKVVPRLMDESFIPSEAIRLRGEAILKTETVQKIWCSVPVYKGDFSAIAEDVYIAKYGREKWNRNDHITTLTESSLRIVSDKTGVAETERVERQKEEEEKKVLEDLAALHLGGDASDTGWEDLYFGDDFVIQS